MKNRRVVVTGLGAITPVGNTVEEYWSALVKGSNGIEPITKFDATGFDTTFAGEVKNFDPLQYIDKKATRRMDLFTMYALATAQQAIEDAAIDFEKVDRNRFGVIYGSGIGGGTTFQDGCFAFNEHKNPKKISPFFVTSMIADIAAGQISIQHGLKGPNYSTVSACATSSHAIADAVMLIERGSADMMICGGAEASVNEMAIGGFNAMRAISTWNDNYKQASRPFDKDRHGFVMGEGAGTLVIEEYEHAKARGAKIYVELAGIGLSADAYHVTAPDPDGDGAVRSMTEAIKDAGLTPQDVDYINAHGTSTPYNDVTETKAIKTTFGEHAYKMVVSSIKSMTGHLLGAAGAIEAIASILSIKNDIIPPTINLDNPDPECDLDYNPHKATQRECNIVVSNTFGFGGHNASLLFKKVRD